jgi:hypothetical protein
MKKIYFVLLFILCSGCASTGYLGNRMRDAGDIFTATVGKFGIAKVRMGPLRTGVFAGEDIAGLRAGEIFFPSDVHDNREETFDSCVLDASEEIFEPGGLQIAKERGKLFRTDKYPTDKYPFNVLYFPFFNIPVKNPEITLPQKIPYYTQIEVAAGIYRGIRLGINPGEILDFILGWTTIDIFDDDLKEI